MKMRLFSTLVSILVLSTASSLADKVLILAPTVFGGANSVEARAATALGYQVDIVNATTWRNMTVGDFSNYRAIILGDPVGGISAIDAAVRLPQVWGQAVNNNNGNVIIMGGDPANHPPAGWILTTNAIRFAANQAGATGLYIALSHYYVGSPSGTPVPVLEPFGTFNVRGVNYDRAHMVTTHPVMFDLNDDVLSNWGNSVHEVFENWPGDFFVLAIADGESTAYTGTDLSVGTPYILVRGEGLLPVYNRITLTPFTASNPTNSTHTVCATVVKDGAFASGVDVTFTVTSGPNINATGTVSTDGNGVACFTYPGNGGVGTDTIVATYVDSNSQTQTSNPVAKTWFNPCPYPLTASIATVYCASNKVIVNFNEMVLESSATSLSHYALNHGFAVTQVSLLPGSQSVIVEADQNFVGGTTYALTISDVTNLCNGLITPNPFVVTFQCEVLCPDFKCPSNIVADCAGSGGTKVHYEVFVNPACPNITFDCFPPSDSFFSAGVTTVTCIAVGYGASNSCSFTVTITDLVPPIIHCPSNIVVTSCTNIAVPYTVTVEDNCCTNLTKNYTPSPGHLFAPGTTTPVHCEVIDCTGNTNSCDFTVTVVAPTYPLTLFNTGVSNSAVLPSGSADPHYSLTTNANGSGNTAWTVSPIPGTWLTNDSTSRWIGPTTNGAGNGGNYNYRMTFFAPCTNAIISGRWAVEDSGSIHINSYSTPVAVLAGNVSSNFTDWHQFAITSGVLVGQNTLDFSVTNGSGATGLRVELSGTVTCCIPTAAAVLTFTNKGNNTLELTWPPDWTLITTTSLLSQTWTYPLTTNSRFFMPMTNAAQFFRLVRTN